MGKHRANDPETVVCCREAQCDGACGFWDGVEEYVGETVRERAGRAGRTLLQGSVGASIVAAALAFLPFDVPAEAVPGIVAALTPVVTYLHKRY